MDFGRYHQVYNCNRNIYTDGIVFLGAATVATRFVNTASDPTAFADCPRAFVGTNSRAEPPHHSLRLGPLPPLPPLVHKTSTGLDLLLDLLFDVAD